MRKTTNRLLELAEDGVLSYKDLAMAALKYMSEDEVEDMATANEFLPEEFLREDEEEEKEDEEEEESFPYSVSELLLILYLLQV